MVDVLANKRAATRFRILVAIADRQPAVSQGEIAEAVGVTSQAVSEYVRELVDDGFVEKEGRSRYRVTTEGVDWVLQAATDMDRFASHVTDDVLGNVGEDAAVAATDLTEGQTVGLTMRDGLLTATADDAGATGVTTAAADAGDVVGVTGFEGVIDLDPGAVTVLQVPSVRSGESAPAEDVADACADSPVVTAAGVEAVGALRTAGVDYLTHFAPGSVAADAASRGLDAVVVATPDTVGRVTDELRDADVPFAVRQD